MQITVNATPRSLPSGATITHLLDLMKVRRDAIAVEVNREIVPRARHAEHVLCEGDVVEIVTFVGGG